MGLSMSFSVDTTNASCSKQGLQNTFDVMPGLREDDRLESNDRIQSARVLGFGDADKLTIT